MKALEIVGGLGPQPTIEDDPFMLEDLRLVAELERAAARSLAEVQLFL